MANRANQPLWQRCRRGFRHFRMAALFLVFLGVAGLTYLNKVGLPEVVKNPILAELRNQGLDLQFSRLRLRWYRGIVAENINLGPTALPIGPQLFIDEIEVRLSRLALLRLQMKVQSVLVRQARLCWTLPATNSFPARPLSVDNLTAEIQFRPADVWEISRLHGRLLDTDIRLAGTLANASFLKRMPPTASTNTVAGLGADFWRQLLAWRDRLIWEKKPEVEIQFRADAREWSLSDGKLSLKLPQLSFPGGGAQDLLFTAIANPSTENPGRWEAEVNASAAGLRAPWLEAQGVRLKGRWTQSAADSLQGALSWQLHLQRSSSAWIKTAALDLTGQSLVSGGEDAGNSTFRFRANDLKTQWVAAPQADVQVSFHHPPSSWGKLADLTSTNATGLLGKWEACLAHLKTGADTNFLVEARGQFNQPQTPWAEAKSLQFKVRASSFPAAPRGESLAVQNWGWFKDWAWMQLDGECAMEGVSSPDVLADQVETSIRWQPPRLNLPRLHAQLFRGRLDARAELNADTREAQAETAFDLDVHQLGLLLPAPNRRWLRQYGWSDPPRVEARLNFKLPEWNLPFQEWERAIDPTMAVEGSVTGGPSSFRGVQASAAQLHFHYWNGLWLVPDLVAHRPEGDINLVYVEDTITRGYYWEGNSRIDPKALNPLLTEPQRDALALFSFTQPPAVSGRVWGRWRSNDELGFQAALQARDLGFRGETCGSVYAPITFTNQLLTAAGIQVRRDTQSIDVDRLWFDFTANRLFLSNAVARIEPRVVTRAIGPKTDAALLPYRFSQPPTVKVDGSLVVTDTDQADLRFAIDGGPFSFSRFNLPKVSGLVHWRGATLSITNFQGEFYQGQIRGLLEANFDVNPGTDVSFQIAVTNADMRQFMRDVSSSTNRLEGALSGELNITHLNSADWKSWQGSGKVQLRQGLIWEIPLFGIFSSVLNSIMPGLGSSRAEQATANYAINSSLIQTKDLEIRASAMRLYYSGLVDFDGNVNARVEAALFRDAWLVGRVFSLAFAPLTKIFEYKVTGTLGQPKLEPLYILPRVLLFPLHPFKTLKDLVTGEESKSAPADSNPRPPEGNKDPDLR